MSNRLVAALSAGALAAGILVGAAGAVLIGNATGSDPSGMSGSMGGMMDMMGGSMRGGVSVDDMAELHAQHHGTDR